MLPQDYQFQPSNQGSAVFTVTLNTQGPVHLTVTDTVDNTVFAALDLAVAGTNLLVNGGFETGNFSGWTQSGDPSYTGVENANPHSGTYDAYFGPTSGLGYISQTVATTPGQTYTLSLWLSHPYADTGTEYQAQIGGTIVDDQVDPGFFPYTNFTYTYTATGTTTTVQLGFHEAPAYWYLDDVSFVANTGPAPHGGSGGHGDLGGAVLPPTSVGGDAASGTSAVARVAIHAPSQGQQAALVDHLFSGVGTTDSTAALPALPLNTGTTVDLFSQYGVGDPTWLL
jgi:hypothetical protein